ncbi:MAG TPA: prepilin-type N-terminal cleavage/methylation domain-containing protein [Acidimicrobiales bacterium]|nr:prepilin-type N-terminal cleavage/methylation domain-containing protein [Acidimicrobiales bacterium]
METLRRRLQKDENGFTLIELMVVVLIIAILIAIAIPTFLGAQNRARDRGAQSDLRNALTAAKTLATDSAGSFEVNGVAITMSDMNDVEPSIDFVAMADADRDSVGVVSTGDTITLVKRSASDTYFGISSTDEGRVTYCRGETLDACDAAGDNLLEAW